MSPLEQIHSYLELLEKIGGDRGFGAFIRKHGQSGTWAAKPNDIKWGIQKKCFRNAAILALDGRGTYFEGYAWCGLVPLSHAWVERDGVVIDNTWRPRPKEGGRAYFGVAFCTDFLRAELLTNRISGLLETRATARKLLDGCDFAPKGLSLPVPGKSEHHSVARHL